MIQDEDSSIQGSTQKLNLQAFQGPGFSLQTMEQQMALDQMEDPLLFESMLNEGRLGRMGEQQMCEDFFRRGLYGRGGDDRGGGVSVLDRPQVPGSQFHQTARGLFGAGEDHYGGIGGGLPPHLLRGPRRRNRYMEDR